MIPAAKDNPFSTYWRKRADRRWSAVIRQAGCCAYCGRASGLEAHHLISRSRLALRHRIECGICLCRHHHRFCSQISPHLAPTAFEAWLQRAYPERYRWIQAHKSCRTLDKIDYRQAYWDLSEATAMNF